MIWLILCDNFSIGVACPINVSCDIHFSIMMKVKDGGLKSCKGPAATEVSKITCAVPCPSKFTLNHISAKYVLGDIKSSNGQVR